jgi:hypothetical protein
MLTLLLNGLGRADNSSAFVTGLPAGSSGATPTTVSGKTTYSIASTFPSPSPTGAWA